MSKLKWRVYFITKGNGAKPRQYLTEDGRWSEHKIHAEMMSSEEARKKVLDVDATNAIVEGMSVEEVKKS